MKEIILREFIMKDLDQYFDLQHPSRLHHQYNGPYFKQDNEEELLEYMEEIKDKLEKGEVCFKNRRVIAHAVTNEYIGEVSYYWKSKETLWMEVGIVVCNENYWGRGIGYHALKEWIDQVFNDHPEIVRIGLSTWSGNERMMALSEKLSLTLEACYKSARIIDGNYYDSVSYGILREEWEALDI